MITPANLMLVPQVGGDWLVKVLDFGLANLVPIHIVEKLVGSFCFGK